MTNTDPFSSPQSPEPGQAPKALTRSDDRMIAGVCAGVAEYFGIDTTLVRIVTVLAVLLGFGAGLVLYVAGWLIMPDRNGQTVLTWRPSQPSTPAAPTTPAGPSAAGQGDDAQEPPVSS